MTYTTAVVRAASNRYTFGGLRYTRRPDGTIIIFNGMEPIASIYTDGRVVTRPTNTEEAILLREAFSLRIAPSLTTNYSFICSIPII